MKEGRPSLTALYVAFSRAVATHDPELARACSDCWAEHLLPSPLRNLVNEAVNSRASAQLLSVLRTSLWGMAEHMALRTRLIDDAVESGVAQGAAQLVVVGAGLDSRAHRLSALAGCDVFEVDFPSTQAFKRRHAHGIPVSARALHYVACDFERTALDQVLQASGFDARVPTVWIWEGVTMYLDKALIASSLDVMARLSAPTSRLAATYITPFPLKYKAFTELGLFILGAVSEPIRSDFEPEAMATLLAAHSLRTLSDLSPRDVAARYSVRFPRFAFGAPGERIIVAEKRTRV